VVNLSVAAQSLWAKSPKTSADPPEGHAVISHLLDVAACVWEILEREPTSTLVLLAQDFHLEVAQARAWVCALAGLHDLGKASPAFQQKWPVGRDRVKTHLSWLGSQRLPPDDTPHNHITQVRLPDFLVGCGWDFDVAEKVSDAIGAHHGFRATGAELQQALETRERGKTDWDEVRLELFKAVLEACGVGQAPNITVLSGAAFQRIAGLTSFADWVGSSFTFAPFDGDARAYFEDAKVQAQSKLDAIGWVPREPLMKEETPINTVFSYLDRQFKARPLQEALEKMLEVDQPALFIVEAPMGEGKTEAAFYAHLELQRRVLHRGLYIALPTQATGNAMFERTKAFLKSRGRQTPPDLQLLHGATELSEAFQSIKIEPNTTDERDQHGEVVARVWFSSRKRALLSEYGVGTVDQALLSILNVKHQFVRLWGLGNRVVVLDEVHAYDAYTGGLIAVLVRWLHALGSSVILMSATLPDRTRRELLEAFDAKNIPNEKYPRITRVVNGIADAVTFGSRPQKAVRLERLAKDVPTVAATLLELTRHGGCAACIVNTVQRAQELYRELEGNLEGVRVQLFHARYPMEERLKRENEVLRLFGKDGDGINPNRPTHAILIATQVVEQSLDLDFDVMVSDLAPVDLLLQRSGRLHRHSVNDVNRHGHDTPRLLVAGLEFEGDTPDLGDGWDKVYAPWILLKTWRVLGNTVQDDVSRDEENTVPDGVLGNLVRILNFPNDIDALVQRVYDDAMPADVPPELLERFEKARADFEKEDREMRKAAKYAVIGNDPMGTDWENAKDKFVDEDDPKIPGLGRALTRLGEDSIAVVPMFLRDGKLYLRETDTQPVTLGAKVDLETAREIYKRSLSLSRKAVVHGIEAHQKLHHLKRPWQKTPLLQNLYPLVLENGFASFGKTVVRLDADLGIVYDKTE
jgi:CRISPR-associated endonuclease/helicase Cas3